MITIAAAVDQTSCFQGLIARSHPRHGRHNSRTRALHQPKFRRDVDAQTHSQPRPMHNKTHGYALSAMAWPLTTSSTLIFLIMLVIYPIIGGMSTFHRSADLASLTYDATFLHTIPDIVACMFASWEGARISGSLSLINPPWCAGSEWRSHGIILAKLILIAALSYPISLIPMLFTCKGIQTPAEIPWTVIISGSCFIASTAALGYALGVILGSRWAIPAAGLIVTGLDWLGIFALQSSASRGTHPSSFGSPVSLLFPVLPSTAGGEPGLTMAPAALLWQIIFRCAIIMICLSTCILYTTLWRGRSTEIQEKLTSFMALLLASALLGAVVISTGPLVWRRAQPFTPTCDTADNSDITVCSYPTDVINAQTYTTYATSFASWNPGNTSPANTTYTLLIGNAFTPSSKEQRWNLTKEGERLIHHSAHIIQMDAANGTQTASLSEFAQQYASGLVGNCSTKPVQHQNTTHLDVTQPLSSSKQINDYLVWRLANAMSELAEYEASGRSTPTTIDMYAGHDRVHRSFSQASNADLRSFYRRNRQKIQSCSLTPADVLRDPISRSSH